MPRQQPPQYPPKRNASRQEWYLYAVNRCRYTDEMETMSRADLIALVEREAPTSFRISSLAQRPERYTCGCIVGGPANCDYATGRASAGGVMTVHGTPLPEVHDDPWPDVDDAVEHEDIRNAAGQTRAEMAARDTGAHVFRWAIADLAEFIDESGTDVPRLPPHVEMRRFVEQIVDDAQTKGQQVCALIRDHDGRLTKVLGYADGHSRVDVEEKPAFVDWGSSSMPRPDPVGVFFNAAWSWLRDNIVVVWATILVIGAIIMIGANPAVGAVSIGVAAAVVLPIAIPLYRRQKRRQALERQQQMLARMKEQHDLWMTDPVEYRRRVEEGEL
ncbi:hypothetical protein SEA_VERITY_5 [Gordonia phage Verity]|uniref:Uncharacterized protein n=1 Tax=Gordonia phage Verity TaxID=2591211 RepID=A0A514DIP9_9CAUD|nr:hypothetical protein J1776_gp05 [Gordonia phage Verity]QDH93491.1 hypothetical protein SEA_VERITY_5 [Gordonia phage Verity]QPO16848.1 hypothetical protein SEA_DELREY21_5 [Gordonia phage Delrey21]QXN74131.1 membrane protein [Gordonia phage DoctorFroggo]